MYQTWSKQLENESIGTLFRGLPLFSPVNTSSQINIVKKKIE